MLQTTNDKALSTQTTKDKRNEAVSASVSNDNVGDRVGGSIKNLSTITNLKKNQNWQSSKGQDYQI